METWSGFPDLTWPQTAPRFPVSVIYEAHELNGSPGTQFSDSECSIRHLDHRAEREAHLRRVSAGAVESDPR